MSTEFSGSGIDFGRGVYAKFKAKLPNCSVIGEGDTKLEAVSDLFSELLGEGKTREAATVQKALDKRNSIARCAGGASRVTSW